MRCNHFKVSIINANDGYDSVKIEFVCRVDTMDIFLDVLLRKGNSSSQVKEMPMENVGPIFRIII